MIATDAEKKVLDKKLFIEDVGMLFEVFNLPRMAGRILGCLLVCNPAEQTASELMTVIGGSKGSISTMTQLLMHSGLVERTGIPGKKGTYYRIKPGSWIELLRNRMGFLRAMRELAARGLALMKDEDAQQCQRLQEIYDLYAFLENEIPVLFERWKQAHSRA
jgi:DNA-binding transcriptional regulator GbsR (MarR family)